MRKAGEVVNGCRSSSGRDETARNGQDAERATVFWSRMASLYGHKWHSQYGSSPDELWATALTTLGSDEIRRGLEACVISGDPWPPSLPEFLAMCRPAKRENAKAYSTAPMLPTPVSSRETAMAGIQAARKRLRA